MLREKCEFQKEGIYEGEIISDGGSEEGNAHLRFATSWASWQLCYLPSIQPWIQQFI